MRILSPLRHRQVALIWSALAFSAIGDQLNLVALSWVAVDALGPAAGYISAAKAATVLITALTAGSLADRWDRRGTMVGADLCRCAILLVLVGAWLVGGRPHPVLLAVAVIVLAAGEAFFEPALQTVLPALVKEPGLLLATNALLDATDRLARLLGPGLIALAGAFIATVHIFTLDALSFLVSAAAIATLRSPGNRQAMTAAAERPMMSERAMKESLLRGFRAVRAEKILSYMLATGGIINGVWYAVFFLAVPLVIADHLGASGAAGLGAYGLVFSCYGCSNLAANLIVGSRRLPRRPAGQMFAGALLTGSGIALMALACAPAVPQALRLPAFACAAAVAGVGGPLKDIPFVTLRQMLIPSADMASAMRAYMIMSYSGLLVAMVLAPMACAGLGAVAVMLAGGAVYAAVAVIGWSRFAGPLDLSHAHAGNAPPGT